MRAKHLPMKRLIPHFQTLNATFWLDLRCMIGLPSRLHDVAAGCALLNKRARQFRSMIQFPYCGTPITAVLSYNLCFNTVHSHCFAAVSTQSNNSLKVRSHRAACCRFRHNIFHNCLIFLKVITPLQSTNTIVYLLI